MRTFLSVSVVKNNETKTDSKSVVTVREMRAEDLPLASAVHTQAFTRQTHSYEWLKCTLNAFPRMLCYVAVQEETVAGYIIWSQKSGFRIEAILELEQIAVMPSSQGQGIGTSLIEHSLQQVKDHLNSQDSRLKHVVVTTRADNRAQALYKKVLGARVEATITNLYSANEVFMIARNYPSHGRQF